MRANFRLSLILSVMALALLLSACSGNSSADSTAPESETAAPETVAETDVPETYVPVIETGEIISPETPTVLRIVYSSDSLGNEQFFAAENLPETNALKIRDASLKSEHGVTLAGFKTSDITSYVNALNGSGAEDCDFILVGAAEGVKLMLNGSLQDMSEAGINIDCNTAGINTQLCTDLAFGGRVSLLFCDALVSDIYSTYCLGVNNTHGATGTADITDSLASSAAAGNLTFELLVTKLAEITPNDDCASIVLKDNSSAIAGIIAAGGNIFVYGTDKLPAADVSSSAFSNACNAVLSLNAATGTDYSGVLEFKKIGDISSGEGIMPLPKISDSASYRSYTDISSVSVLAAPEGVRSGTRTSRLFAVLCECSAGVRESAVADIAAESGCSYSAECLKLIAGSQCTETAACYGWGNLDSYFASGLLSGENVSSLLSAKTCSDRLKTAATAVRIIAEKLKS